MPGRREEETGLSDPLRALVEMPRDRRASMGIEYTPLEIRSQPRVWMKNFSMLRSRVDEVRSFVESRILKRGRVRVILSGAGTSNFIGLSVENLLRKRWQVDVETRASTDIVTGWDSTFLRDVDTTLISFSRSGNSPESVAACMLADKFLGEASHIVVTCNRRGKLAELKGESEDALLLLMPEEAEDRGLAMTVSYTTMVSTAQFLAYIRDLEEYERIVKSQARATEKILREYSSLLKEISELGFKRAFFLGSSALYGCAAESSLKLQELTAGRIICKSDSFMGFRHGPEVAVDDESLVIFYVSTDPFVRRYELDLMADMHAKGLGMVKLAVCNGVDGEIEEYVDHVIEFEGQDEHEIPDLCRPIMDVTVAQTLALFKSLNLGLRPDEPSESGVITRVVKGVKIYDHERFKKEGVFEASIG
jgi:tagatose-6-phosphate ketose/aldose isomerase